MKRARVDPQVLDLTGEDLTGEEVAGEAVREMETIILETTIDAGCTNVHVLLVPKGALSEEDHENLKKACEAEAEGEDDVSLDRFDEIVARAEKYPGAVKTAQIPVTIAPFTHFYALFHPYER